MKKGFSLIEVLVTASIIIILSSFCLLSYLHYRNMKSDIDAAAYKSEILALINYSKQYCRENKMAGYILFDVVSNQIKFYSGGKKIENIILPKGMIIYSVNTEQSKVDIDKDGFTSDAGTIKIRDSRNNLHTITINVGVGYAEIK